MLHPALHGDHVPDPDKTLASLAGACPLCELPHDFSEGDDQSALSHLATHHPVDLARQVLFLEAALGVFYNAAEALVPAADRVISELGSKSADLGEPPTCSAPAPRRSRPGRAPGLSTPKGHG